MDAIVRRVALLTAAAGAILSIGLMFYAGRHQRSLLLIALFTIWDLSPFAAFAFAHLVSKDWPVPRRATLIAVMLVIAIGSVAIYAVVALGPPRPQPAFFFLVVPLASWVLMGIAYMIGVRK